MTEGSFSRKELEEMVDRWLIANKKAEDIGNWKILESFYREDAIYCWNMGPNQEFVARSREEIREYALGYWMKGFEGWNYPYHDVIIDEKRGTVVAFWEQIAPGKRADGTPYKVAGLSGSWFEYAGNYQWKSQRDFLDIENVKALTFELAGNGLVDPDLKHKIYQQCRGQAAPDVEFIRPEPDCRTKVWNVIAMIKICRIWHITLFTELNLKNDE
jgi:hypothetical protein